ncbi:MAG: diphthine synthase [Candidatus Caldarchaeum sp.]|nr:diphthine synthase [Candidatus Caldarchaeum sp.]MDW8435743.1 diphthine synthase [Candidatus Caldarchaeum sp.]
MGLIFIGAGLGRFENMTIEALEEAKKCDKLYVDVYTSIWSDDFFEKLSQVVPNYVRADRKLLEDDVYRILVEAKDKEVGILVPGDPFIATTHSAVRTLAHRKNIPVKIIHGTSIISSAISVSGLHVYKFGKPVTVPKTDDLQRLRTVLVTVQENLSRGLHTLLLLDTADDGLTAKDALAWLTEAAAHYGMGWLNKDTVVVVCAKLGSPQSKVDALPVNKVFGTPLPPPPHCIIIPSKLHFSEKEVMSTYSELGFSEEHLGVNPLKNRVQTYVEKCRRILAQLSAKPEMGDYLRYVSSYVDDAEKFFEEGDVINSLLAIGYAEGLLDGLRMLKGVDFRW